MGLSTSTACIPQQKLDLLYNALLVGMAPEDGYVFASFTEREIMSASEDDVLQLGIAQLNKQFEYQLLAKLDTIIEKQVNMGKENAVTWALEKMYPRYSNKPTSNLPDLHIHLKDDDPEGYDTVAIHKPVAVPKAPAPITKAPDPITKAPAPITDAEPKATDAKTPDPSAVADITDF